jgi:hypothetical protein
MVGAVNKIDLVPTVLCRWYWDDFAHLFEEVGMILKKRNSHCHNVFHILDEDIYEMSSATAHHKAMMSGPERKKLRQQHSLKDLHEVVERTSECISQLENLMGTPSKGPILTINFLKLPEKERLKIVERENRPTERKRRPGTAVSQRTLKIPVTNGLHGMENRL